MNSSLKAWLLPVILLAALAACDKPAAPSAGPSFKTTATIQDLMVAVVDPAADLLWASVATELSKDGLVEKQPRTDEEWLAVRQQAIILVESANLLQIPGRSVVAAGGKLEDAHVPGILSPAEAQKAIHDDQAGFNKAAEGFHEAAAQALTAVDARNVGGLLEAGSRIQQACENCHVKFWYPNAQKPPR
ncbi:cytochrome c [Ferribacterium limneticum]|uniref:cytochrome c n=1 Tax=Ferribacterium limneticum TaxID=76259 RepID=UPI001CFBCB7F|nr:cytochrome c [Ferribacterium limneticum]UCV20086.1 cytochrome c [Ferribacterium limneticum]